MVHRQLLFLCLWLCLGLGARGAVAIDVTVLPLGGREPLSMRSEITEVLRAEIKGLGFSVQSKGATDQVLADAKTFGNLCSVTVTSCAIQMGSLAGAHTVVTGVVDEGKLSIWAIDVTSEREIGRTAVPVVLTSPVPAVRLAAVRLLRPAEEVGALSVVVDVVGAAVGVDGVPRGVTPLPSISLSPGPHEVLVSHVEYDSQTYKVEVAFGRTTTLEVSLRGYVPRPRPPGEPPPPPAALPVDDRTPIIVLDVVPPDPPRRDTAVMAGLLTESLVHELRRRRDDPLTVATPTDVARLLGAAGQDDIEACSDDVCVVKRLEQLWPRGEVVLVHVGDVGGTFLHVNAGRYTLGSPAMNTTEDNGSPQKIVGLAPKLIDELFAELPASVTLKEPAPDFAARLTPKPVSLPVFVATVGGVVVGAAVGVGSFVGYSAAGGEPGASLGWGVGMVGGAVVAAGCLTSAIIESVFVDWHGHEGENDELLADIATRSYSSR